MLSHSVKLSYASLTWLVVMFSVALPRLAVMGSLPGTDEGIYAFYAQLMHRSLVTGHGLPDTGMLALYPMLLAWVFELSTNHIIALRLIDMIVALVAGFLFYRIVEHESRSRLAAALISFVFLFTLNQPLFIQAGFKNSMFAAFVPLFAAVRLAQDIDAKTEKLWFLIGALTALAVLLRETFLPFFIMGGLATLVAYGSRPFLRYSVGAAVGGGVILLIVLCARGGWQSLFQSYVESGALYASMANQRTSLFISNGILSAKEALVSMILAGLGLAAALFSVLAGDRLKIKWRLAFWVSAALVPLFEPLGKIGFPYHFSVCLPGMGGLCALGWRSICANNDGRIKEIFAAGVVACSLPFLWPKVTLLTHSWAATKTNLESVKTGQWPPAAIANSNYLFAADAIRRASPSNGTVSVSGFMLALFPLSGMLPPSADLTHLTALIIRLGLDEHKFSQALLSCPPDVLMTTTRTAWCGDH